MDGKIALINDVASLLEFVKDLHIDTPIKIKRPGNRGHSEPIFEVVQESDSEAIAIEIRE